MKKQKTPKNKPKALSVHRRETQAKVMVPKEMPDLTKVPRESEEDPYLRIYRYYFGD